MAATILDTRPATYSRATGLINVLRSEFLKIRSVRSTYWTLAGAVVFNVVLASVVAQAIPSRLSAQDRKSADPIQLSMAGLHLSQIAIGVLGVLVITSEYGTGLIRATVAAVPRRRELLLAKAAIFALVATVGGVISTFGAYVAFQVSLPAGGKYMKVTLSDPGVLRAVIGAGLFLAVLGLLGMGIGAIVRASAGAIAGLFGLLFVPNILFELLPSSWRDTVGPYLPMNAGDAVTVAFNRSTTTLAPWTGFGVFCLYALVALTIGLVLIKRRDV